VSQLSNPETRQAFANSAVVATCATLLALALGAPAAYGLARFQFSVRMLTNKDITVWFLSQRVLPPVATVIPSIWSCARSACSTPGWPDPDQRHFILPFVVVILRQTFLDLPVELEEAALVDGATHFGAFSRVALPLAAPAMARDGADHLRLRLERVPVCDHDQQQQFDHDPCPYGWRRRHARRAFWFMATRAVIAMIPPVLLALLAQRYIVRGLTLGRSRADHGALVLGAKRVYAGLQI